MRHPQLYVLLLLLIGCRQPETVEVFEFPEGWHGWAVAVWGVEGKPPSRTEGNRVTVQFADSGIAITSTPLNLRATRQEFYFIDAAGHRVSTSPIVGFAGNGFMYDDKTRRAMDYTRVFVGTKAEFRANRDTPLAEKLWDSGLSSTQQTD